MSRVTRPALRGSLLGTILRLWNPVMREILTSPIHWPLSRWFAVVAWTGRKTGRRHSTPVSFIREGPIVWVTTGDRWWRYVTRDATVQLRLGGRWHDVTATVIDDEAVSASAHERLFRDHAWFRLLSGIPGDSRGGADPDAVAKALQSGRVLVRIDLAP